MSTCGNTIAHGTVGRRGPTSSPLMKLPQASGGESERHQRRDKIGDVEPALRRCARAEPQRDQHAEEAAVEAHPALPYLKDLQRMREVVERLVEQDVTEAAAEDHAEHAVEQHVVDVARMPARSA